MRNADCGMRIEKENQKNPKSEITGPLLSARSALASGPQACFYPGNGDGGSNHHIQLLEGAGPAIFPQEDAGSDDLAAELILAVF